MSAASPRVPDKAQEPSMEEILASIRRIIADDQNAKAEVVEPVRAAPPLPENDDVLDLAEVAQPVRKPAAFEEPEIAFREAPRDADGQIDFDAIDFGDELEPEPEPMPPPRAVAPPEPPPPAPQPVPREPEPAPPSTPHDRLTSAVTDASVAQAFQMLSGPLMSSQARTMEEVVQDMLRPMLKDWLDENLPTMVERLVRAEIERVSRGR